MNEKGFLINVKSVGKSDEWSEKGIEAIPGEERHLRWQRRSHLVYYLEEMKGRSKGKGPEDLDC
jgi:hypothetical protein